MQNKYSINSSSLSMSYRQSQLLSQQVQRPCVRRIHHPQKISHSQFSYRLADYQSKQSSWIQKLPRCLKLGAEW